MNKYMACRIGVTSAILLTAVFVIVTCTYNPLNINIGFLGGIYTLAKNNLINILLMFVTAVVVLLNCIFSRFVEEEAQIIPFSITASFSFIYMLSFFSLVNIENLTDTTRAVLVVCVILMIGTWITPFAYRHVSKPVCRRIWGGSDE